MEKVLEHKSGNQSGNHVCELVRQVVVIGAKVVRQASFAKLVRKIMRVKVVRQAMFAKPVPQEIGAGSQH